MPADAQQLALVSVPSILTKSRSLSRCWCSDAAKLSHLKSLLVGLFLGVLIAIAAFVLRKPQGVMSSGLLSIAVFGR